MIQFFMLFLLYLQMCCHCSSLHYDHCRSLVSLPCFALLLCSRLRETVQRCLQDCSLDSVDIKLQKSQIKSQIYTIILKKYKNMNKIEQKLKQIISPNTKSSYQIALKYLLRIINDLLKTSPIKQRQEQYLHRSNKVNSNSQKRCYSQSNNSKYVSVFVPDHDQSEEIDGCSQFKGSQISIVQKCIDELELKKGEGNKKDGKLDLRGLQKGIEIYHQCLQKALEVIVLQHEQLMKRMQKKSECTEVLEQYWKRYEENKKRCRKFNDLANVCQKHLATQFLSVLKPFKKALMPRKPRQIQYVLVNN